MLLLYMMLLYMLLLYRMLLYMLLLYRMLLKRIRKVFALSVALTMMILRGEERYDS